MLLIVTYYAHVLLSWRTMYMYFYTMQHSYYNLYKIIYENVLH
jgi:hypothetical protein